MITIRNTKIMAIQALILLLLCMQPGCTYKQLVVGAGFVMAEEAINAFYEESDTQLAKEAAPANLKLLEGMARGDMENEELQIAASQLIGMYAFGFLEDCCPDEDEQEIGSQRARILYLRGRDLGIFALQEKADFRVAMESDLTAFKEHLKVYKKKHVPALFWTAFNWGLYINLSRSDLEAVANLTKVVAMAQRVIELDEHYFYGGAHMFLMVYHGSLGKAVGGSPEKTKAAYDKASKISKGRFLMTKYLFAKLYAQQTFDRPLFEKLLREISSSPVGLLKEMTLANELAKEKATRLLGQADDLF